MLNGKSGYVLQPPIMRDDNFDPFDRHTVRGVEQVTLDIEVHPCEDLKLCHMQAEGDEWESEMFFLTMLRESGPDIVLSNMQHTTEDCLLSPCRKTLLCLRQGMVWCESAQRDGEYVQKSRRTIRQSHSCG